MTCNRRRFLQTAGLALGSTWARCHRQNNRWQGFHWAMCNESMKGWTWEEQCRLVGQAGFTGIEIAPFTLVKEGVEELSTSQRQEMVRIMQIHGLTCAGLHWLLVAPPAGLHCTTNDVFIRQRTWQYVHRLIDFAADLGGPVLVFGSPKQRSARDAGISVVEARKRLTEGLAQCTEHARRCEVKILLEPLDHSQTDVVNTLAECLQVVDAIGDPAIQTMFDFHNTPDEIEPMAQLVKRYFPYIHHVHVQEMNGRHLGTGSGSIEYLQTFQTLKDLAYSKWISLEVFDFAPGAQAIATESLKTLQAMQAKLS